MKRRMFRADVHGVSSMRNLFLSSVALSVLACAAANAADLPSRTQPYSPSVVYTPSVMNWTGFYVGVNAGAAIASGTNNAIAPGGDFLNPAAFPPAALPAVSGFGQKSGTNFTGGFQAGYNYQLSNNLVLGIEGDVNYRNRNRSGAFASTFPALAGAGPFTGADGFSYSGQNRNEWFATLRPRIGIALDRAMPYLTGGLAYSGTGSSSSAQFSTAGAPTGGAFLSTGGNKTVGWAVGGGLEYSFTNNLSAKAEYLYVNMDHGSQFLVNAANPTYFYVNKNEDRMHVVRAGLNYRFGGSNSAVLARY